MARYDALRTGSFLLAAFAGAFAFAACGGGENTRPEATGGMGGAGTGGSTSGSAGAPAGGSAGSTGGSSGSGSGASGAAGSAGSAGSAGTAGGGSCLGTGTNPLIANFDGDSVLDPTTPANYIRSGGLLPGGTYAY